MHSFRLRVLFLALLTVNLVLPALAQTSSAPSVKAANSPITPFSALEGKWVKYSSSPPTYFLISTHNGKPLVQWVGPKTTKLYDCQNVKYENGLLSFDFPGKPVPVYKLTLVPDGKRLTGEVVHPAAAYAIPTSLEKVDAWPSEEDLKARGPAGPITVRQ